MTRAERLRYHKEIRTFKCSLLLMLFTFILISGLVLTINVMKSNAQQSDTDYTYKYFTSIAVKYGDTLYSLAEEYTSGYDVDLTKYIEEVKHINHLEDDTIQSGQYLVIPYYSQELKGI